jgi:hypothetical protein
MLLADVAIGNELSHCDVRASWTATSAHADDYLQMTAGLTTKMEIASTSIGTGSVIVHCFPELLPASPAVLSTEKPASRYPAPEFNSWYRRTTPIEGEPPRI